jgi:hypothetical protein
MHGFKQVAACCVIRRSPCRAVNFGNRGTTLASNGPLTVLGSDNDGWIRMQASTSAVRALTCVSHNT